MKAKKFEKKIKKQKIKSDLLYEGKILDLRIDYFKDKEIIKRREIVTHLPAVAILPITDTEEIMLVQQYRHGADKILIEIPAGLIEKDEDPIKTAQRELQEEIFKFPKNLTFLFSFYPTAGFCDEFVYLYLAKDLIDSELKPDYDEEIDILTVSIDKCLKMIETGEIEDAKTILAIYYYLSLKEKK